MTEIELAEKARDGVHLVRLRPPLEARGRRMRCEWDVVGQDAAVELAGVLAKGHPSRWTDVFDGSGRLVSRIEPTALAAPEQETLL